MNVYLSAISITLVMPMTRLLPDSDQEYTERTHMDMDMDKEAAKPH